MYVASGDIDYTYLCVLLIVIFHFYNEDRKNTTKKMAVQRHVFTTIIIITLSFRISCRCSTSSPEEVRVIRSTLVDGEAFGYDTQAYPSYLRMLEDGSFINYMRAQVRDDDHILHNMVDENATWLQTVNVDDFGAKGDGTEDDTEVFKLNFHLQNQN